MNRCNSCGYDNPDSNRFCEACGAPLTSKETTDYDASDLNNNENSTQNNTEYSMPVVESSVTPQPPLPNVPKKHSTMSILAIICSLLCCISFIGLILGIVDLVNAKKENPPQRHELSIVAVVIGGLMLLMCIVYYPTYLKRGGNTTPTTTSTTTSVDVSELLNDVEDQYSEMVDDYIDDVSGDYLDTDTETTTTTETTTEATTTTTTVETTNSKLETPCSFTVNDVDVYIEVMYMDSLPFDDGLGLYELPNNYQYMVVGIGFYNGNNYDVYVSTYDFQVYADNILCNEEYIYADGIESSATISSGRQAVIYGVYEVPINANTVEIEYTQDFLSDTVVITVDETSDWSG